MPEVYSDINAPRTNESFLVLDADAVFESLRNIFTTERNERLFNLDLTSDLEALLFHEGGVNEATAALIYGRILQSIQQHEPRVRIINSQSYVRPNAEGDGYDATFVCEITGFNQSFQFNLDLLNNEN